jgi:hypothetical protein
MCREAALATCPRLTRERRGGGQLVLAAPPKPAGAAAHRDGSAGGLGPGQGRGDRLADRTLLLLLLLLLQGCLPLLVAGGKRKHILPLRPLRQRAGPRRHLLLRRPARGSAAGARARRLPSGLKGRHQRGAGRRLGPARLLLRCCCCCCGGGRAGGCVHCLDAGAAAGAAAAGGRQRKFQQRLARLLHGTHTRMRRRLLIQHPCLLRLDSRCCLGHQLLHRGVRQRRAAAQAACCRRPADPGLQPGRKVGLCLLRAVPPLLRGLLADAMQGQQAAGGVRGACGGWRADQGVEPGTRPQAAQRTRTLPPCPASLQAPPQALTLQAGLRPSHGPEAQVQPPPRAALAQAVEGGAVGARCGAARQLALPAGEGLLARRAEA